MYTEKKKPIDMTNREMQAKVAWVFVKPERIKSLNHFLKKSDKQESSYPKALCGRLGPVDTNPPSGTSHETCTALKEQRSIEMSSSFHH